MELSEETPKLVAVGCGFVPFSDTPVVVFMESLGVSTAFAVAPGAGAAKREEGLEVSAAKSFSVLDWTGGGGAWYLTLVECD